MKTYYAPVSIKKMLMAQNYTVQYLNYGCTKKVELLFQNFKQLPLIIMKIFIFQNQ